MTFWFCKHSVFIISLRKLSQSLVQFFPSVKRAANISRCQCWCKVNSIVNNSSKVSFCLHIICEIMSHSLSQQSISRTIHCKFPQLHQQLLIVMDSYFWILYSFWLISSHYFLQFLCRILSLKLIELKSFPKMTFGFNYIYVPLTSDTYI